MTASIRSLRPRPRRLWTWILIVGAWIALSGMDSEVSAQDPDWQKVGRRPETKSQATPSAGVLPERLVAVQFGYPGVFSPRVLIPIEGRNLGGVGLTLIPGLTAVGFEYRYQLMHPREGVGIGFQPGAALTIYNVSDRDRSTTPVGLNLFMGMVYRTQSQFAIGGDIGVMQTTGSKKDNPVESFGVRKGLSTGYVSFSLGYYF